MYHTAELHEMIERTEYWEYRDRLFKNGKQKKFRVFIEDATGHVVCTALSEFGITKVSLVNSNKGIAYFGLWIQVNPKRVLENENFTDVFRSEDVERFFIRANELLSDLLGVSIDVSTMDLNRIDVCANVRFETPEAAEQYMKLLCRGRVPKSYQIYTKYNKQMKKKRAIKGTFYLVSKYCTINIYDKGFYAQKQKEIGKYQYKDSDCMLGVIRFEIQLKKNKIRRIVEKLRISSLRSFLNRGEEVASELFGYYLPKLYGYGDFFNTSRAFEILEENQSSFKKKTFTRIKDLMKLTTQKRSLDTAIKIFENDDGIKCHTVKTLLKSFDAMNVNPINIPRDWSVLNLPNPLFLVLTEIYHGRSQDVN